MQITKDTVVIVTGGTRGFGRALIEEFALHGARVYGTYKTSEGAAKNIQEVHPNVKIYKVDSSNLQDIEDFVNKVAEREGRIDILINNAGTVQERKKVVDLSLGNWQDLINVHLTGTFIYCQKVIPHMLKNNSGLIINISSRFGSIENAKPEFAALNVVKAGINMLTRVMFYELKDTGIRVNAVIPAPTLTNFLTTVFSKEEIEDMRQKETLGEISELVRQVNDVIADDNVNGELVLSKRLK
jgi:3-oxoacyl-[acyl-carrier protein] reductase